MAATSSRQAMPQSIQLLDTLISGIGERIALVEAAWDERRRVSAERPQAAREHRGGRHAVDIEIAEHDDVAPVADCRFQRVDNRPDAGYLVWIAPIAVEAGAEETIGLLVCRNAARRHDGGDELGQREPLAQTRDHMRIGRIHLELR